ncbi:MAG: serine/threonine-protein kinase [Gemmataceae bacterium]
MTPGTRTSADGTRPGDPPPLDLSGRTLGDFQVLRKLGQGGMGQVYLAEQVSLRRKVALKILRPELAADAKAIERFQREATTLAQATHANIVQIYAISQHEGIWYIALEYVEGRNLKDYVSRKGPPDLPIVLSVMAKVASALQRAGELGIIHRDIKPENILLTRKGEAKVADFGLARDPVADATLHLTQTGVTMGTPLYMSPEQVEGKPVDCRTDIYSFGVTCYYMLTGQPPFRGATAFEVAVQHVNKPPPPLAQVRPDLPEAVCAVVRKMMAKEPDQRYQTGRDLLRDVARLRDGLGPTSAQLAVGGGAVALDDSSQEAASLRPAVPRSWLIAAAAGSLLLAGLAGAALAWLERRDAARPGPEAPGPADGAAVEAAPQPNKRETALRTLVEEALAPSAGKPPDATAAFANCMELGLLYLDGDRLDEAEKLFTRLEAVPQPPALPLLGQLGRGIVLALRNQPKESNALFCRVFARDDPRLVGPPGKGKKAGLPALTNLINSHTAPVKPFLHHERGRHWIGQARRYNHENGVPEAQVPRYLLVTFPLDGKARK